MKIDVLDEKGITLSGTLMVHNPNAYAINVTGTDAILYLNGRKTGDARLLKPVRIPATYHDEVAVTIRSDFDNGSVAMLPILLGIGIKREADVAIQGTLHAKAFLFRRAIPFDYSYKASF